MKANFELMAEYNRSMNESLFKAAMTLSSDMLNEDRGAFFKSISGTLNHILVGDTIWLKRFANHPYQFTALDYVHSLPIPAALSCTLYEDFDELFAARVEMDRVITQFVSELTDDVLDTPLSYRNMKGDLFTKKFGYLILHFFNHQTHHRGQASTLLNQAGVDIGVTDLLVHIP